MAPTCSTYVPYIPVRSYWQTNLDTVTGGLGVSLERARKVAVRFPYLLAADPTELLRYVF